LLYATRSFAYIRDALALGTALVFAPLLALALAYGSALPGGELVAIWGAKAALNTWRCATALVRIHVCLWPTWSDSEPAPAGGTPLHTLH